MSENSEFENVLGGWPESEFELDEYVRFDERLDVLASLDLLDVIAPLLGDRPLLWKWAVIGAHDALQGAMVCALADTTGTSVLEKPSREKMLKWLDGEANGKAPPKEDLADFEHLLKQCRTKALLTLERPQARDIRRLHSSYRNDFAHFTPKGWSIQISGLPPIIDVALNSVEQLMRQPSAVRHLEEHEQQRLAKTMASIRTSLDIASGQEDGQDAP